MPWACERETHRIPDECDAEAHKLRCDNPVVEAYLLNRELSVQHVMARLDATNTHMMPRLLRSRIASYWSARRQSLVALGVIARRL